MTRLKAVRCTQNGRTFYVTVLTSDVLKRCCYITRRNENVQEGFQRNLNSARASNIANYLDKQKGIIPTPLILSAEADINFNYDEPLGELEFEPAPNTFLILDGQHRFYGLYKSEHIYEIPVVVFTNISLQESVNLFIDINSTQKGVPRSLIIDIKRLAGTETSIEERQRLLFDYLNEDSVLAGKLSPSQTSPGKISRSLFNEATRDLFEISMLAGKDDNTIAKIVRNYFEVSEIVLAQTKSSNVRITGSNIFKALMLIIDDVVNICLQRFGNLKKTSLNEVLDPIALISFEGIVGTSNKAAKGLASEMKLSILQNNVDIDETDDLF